LDKVQQEPELMCHCGEDLGFSRSDGIEAIMAMVFLVNGMSDDAISHTLDA
jgi:hypothetical protein